MNMQDVITIDGPAGSGKSTVSRLVAKMTGRIYLDTGAMYRAVALAAKRGGVNPSDGKSLKYLCESLNLHFNMQENNVRLFLDSEDISLAIRSPEIDMLSSNISAVGEVRKAMSHLQRKIAEDHSLVAEGRDMGTVVFPEAKHKFFLTASPEVRAERRYRERVDRGEAVSRKVVEAEVRKRDHQDQTRHLSPLRPAVDARVIDSTQLEVEKVVSQILYYLKKQREPEN